MKKIFIFAAVVVVLIAIIKIGGPVFTASVGGDKTPTQEQETDTTESVSETAKKVTIEIQNENGETEPETAEVSTEAGEQQVGESQTASITSTETAATIQEYAVHAIDKTMYAIKAVNVRESYSTDSPIVSGLKAGQEIHATGESENGWIRIDYTGKTAYVYKSYLSTSKADVETTKAAATKPATTKPAATKPATTKPAATQPAPGQSQPETAPSTTIPETIAPFPG